MLILYSSYEASAEPLGPKDSTVCKQNLVCERVSETMARFFERFPILHPTGASLHKTTTWKHENLRTCLSEGSMSRTACTSLHNDWSATETHRLRAFRDADLLKRDVQVLGVQDHSPESMVHRVVLTIRRTDFYRMPDGKQEKKVSEYLVGVNADDHGKILSVDLKTLL